MTTEQRETVSVYVGVVHEAIQRAIWLQNARTCFLWDPLVMPVSPLPARGQTVRLWLNKWRWATAWEPITELEYVEQLERDISRPLAPVSEPIASRAEPPPEALGPFMIDPGVPHSPEIRVQCLLAVATMSATQEGAIHLTSWLDAAAQLEDWCYR